MKPTVIEKENMEKKITKSSIQPIGEFLRMLVNIEAKYKKYGLIMRTKKKDLWQGEEINIPKLKNPK